MVVNQITVGQLIRGNQTIQSWFNAVRQAESTSTPSRRELYRVYKDITIDGFLDELMEKRIRGVVTLPLEWSGLENEKVKENLSAPWMRDFIRSIQRKLFYGVTVGGFNTGADGMLETWEEIPHQNVKPEKSLITLNGYSEDDTNAVRYLEPPYKNWILQIGKKTELGKLATVAPYILLKRQNLSDLARYNEMFGMDLRVYEYDPSKPTARQEAESSAVEYGSAAYIVIPRGAADIKFVQSNKQSSSSAYETLHNLLNKELTVAILGQTLTTGGEQGGSYELGKVHLTMQDEMALEDRITAEYIINYQLKKDILIPNGYPLEGVTASFKVPDRLPKELKANMWIALAKSGLPIAEEDFYKEFGIPFPNSRAVLVVSKDTPPAPPEPPGNDPPKPTPPAPAGKPAGSTRAKLQAYYRNYTLGKDQARGAITLSYQDELSEIIDDIIRRVLNGSLIPGDVDPKLWELVAKQLFSAVERGYGTKLTAATGTDKEMLETLRNNVYRFSGFKNYHFVLEANALLRDETGNLRGFSDFQKAVLNLNKEYNINFLRTEYNHAVATSRMASKWQRFTEDEAALPLLQFETVGDDRTRAAHQKLDGIIKPVNDAFWNRFLPPLDYNCRCTVRQLADGEASTISLDELGEPKKGFGVNWGKERVIFPPTHPQFDVDSSHQQQADNNFGLPV